MVVLLQRAHCADAPLKNCLLGSHGKRNFELAVVKFSLVCLKPWAWWCCFVAKETFDDGVRQGPFGTKMRIPCVDADGTDVSIN